MKRVYACLVAVFAAASVSVVAQSGPRRDGNWEVTMQMEMPGMPAAMPATKMTQCITPQEASDPSKSVPQRPAGRGGSGDCKVSDYKVDGNKVTWNMKCEGARPMTGTGEFVYEKDSYTGTMKMDMGAGGPGGGVMTMKYTGKRLGDCTK